VGPERRWTLLEVIWCWGWADIHGISQMLPGPLPRTHEQQGFIARRLEVYQLDVVVDKAALTSAIDDLIHQKGLTGVIAYEPLRSSSPRQLIRLREALANGGDWAGSVRLICLAMRCGRLESLPIQLDWRDVLSLDLESQAASMRQYSLFSRRLGRAMELTSWPNYWLGNHKLVLYYGVGDSASAADPGCSRTCQHHDPDNDQHLSGTFRSVVAAEMIGQGSHCVARVEYPSCSAAASRIRQLVTQWTPPWGCTMFNRGTTSRCVIISGENASDAFAAHIYMSTGIWPGAHIHLWSTEEPQGDGKGVTGSPRAAGAAWQRMGSDAWLIPTLNEAIRANRRETAGWADV